MDSFEYILTMIYSLFCCMRDTQGILTHQVIHSSGYFFLQTLKHWQHVFLFRVVNAVKQGDWRGTSDRAQVHGFCQIERNHPGSAGPISSQTARSVMARAARKALISCEFFNGLLTTESIR
jgi:hypothetical protein